MDIVANIPGPDDCVSKIYEYSGHRFEPEIATDVWLEILEHKWHLSEKLGRDVGIKVACLDFVENTDIVREQAIDAENADLLKELGAQMVDRSVWDTISDSQPPKRIVDKRIILPLTETGLALKHGVIPPKAIIFFGPPGTGKTHFVRAIAGILQWWRIEVSPSDLMRDGADRVGANLKRLMERARNLDKAVLFIDEFEEIAESRDQASRVDKSITNEFLKQVSLFKKHGKKILLVCATNYIRQLDAALLRPGRFDCIIPVGVLEPQARKIVFQHYLSRTNRGEVDVEKIVSMIPLFTPADIEYLFQKVTQVVFEREYMLGSDYRVTTDIFTEIIPTIRPTLTEEMIQQFQQDEIEYTRY
jgi:transitional endoplasmic reticulum ATPase